jgi:predicted secreted protein
MHYILQWNRAIIQGDSSNWFSNKEFRRICYKVINDTTRKIKELRIEILISIFIGMKKLLFLFIFIIILSACNKPVCPAYSDSANSVKTSIIQSGAYRANGIDKFYRDSYRKK